MVQVRDLSSLQEKQYDWLKARSRQPKALADVLIVMMTHVILQRLSTSKRFSTFGTEIGFLASVRQCVESQFLYKAQ